METNRFKVLAQALERMAYVAPLLSGEEFDKFHQNKPESMDNKNK